MLSTWARISAVAGAVLIATILALPAHAATTAPGTSTTPGTSTAVRSGDQVRIIPRSGTDCNPNPLAAVSECTTVIGSGLKISQITGIAISNVPYNITEVHIQIYGPKGTIHNCPNITLQAFSTAGCTWPNPNPNATMPAGDYCSTAWEHIAGGSYARLSTECINVHS